MNRYGDTPLGMVESALEFARICEDLNYHNIVFSMKSSNTQVMVEAYRLLVNKMIEAGMNYPLHLGVTEAGDGEDGRIKSATGIGTLLEDGLGDTIRVSLTEEPEAEIPVAYSLVKRYDKHTSHSKIRSVQNINYNPFNYNKRIPATALNIGGRNLPRVIADLSDKENICLEDLSELGMTYLPELDKWELNEQTPDYLYFGNNNVDLNLPESIGQIKDYENWKYQFDRNGVYPKFTFSEFLETENISTILNFVEVTTEDVFSDSFKGLADKNNVVLVSTTSNNHGMADQRRLFIEMQNRDILLPVIIKREYQTGKTDEFMLFTSTDVGGLFIDGFGDGVWIKNENINKNQINSIAFGILQAARVRISKTEYIACPSCGRTLFKIQDTLQKIKARTSHLKGLKIGVMGCCVNGPGEMADADYGYVGAGKGKISLYKGKQLIKVGIKEDLAVEALVNLIKENKDWK